MLTRSRVKAAPKRKPPPSPAHHAEPSDSEVEVLDEVPRHLQKRNNAKRPIAVLDSDDEAEEIQFGEADRHLWAGLTEADLEMMETDAREKSRSRSHSGSEELLGSPPSPKEPKVGPSRLNKAGPSSPLEAGPANPTKRARFQEASPAPEAPALSESQRLLPKLLDILPDICPTFALQKLETLLNSEHKDSFVERLVDYALELPGGYPKAGAVDKTEKGKGGVVVSIEDKEMYRNIRYRINERMGRGYLRNSLIALEEYFEYMPSLHIRTEFFSQSSLYTPTFLVLQQQSQEEHKPYAQLKMPRGARKGKGKVVLVEPGSSADDAGDGGIGEFEAEKHWLLNVLAEENVAKEHAESKRIAHDEAIANGGGIECGCCFGEEIWKDASKCPLWDSNEKQTEAANIVAAGDAAAVRVRAAAAAEGIELGDNDLAVPPPSGLDKIPLGAPTGAEAAAAVDAWFLGVDLRQRMLNNQLEAANLQAGLRVAQARALPVHLANAHPAHPAARDPIPAAEPRMVAPLPRRAGEPPQALDRQLRRKNAQIG
ncbi:hypothetical protein P7C73_g904, partial [Tremellales sp. Uapishka_1]